MIKLDREIYDFLTTNEKRVVSFMMQNPEVVATSSVNELAALCHISKTVVTTCAQKMGYEGYAELRIIMRNALAKEEPIDSEDIQSSTLDAINKTYKINQESSLQKVAKKIIDCDTIYVIGRGPSKHMADYLTHQLMLMEIKTIAIQEYNHYEVAAKTMNADDIIIAISLSGETRIILDTVRIATLNNRNVVSITSFGNNPLSNMSTDQIYFISEKTNTARNDMISRVPLLITLEFLVEHVKNIRKERN